MRIVICDICFDPIARVDNPHAPISGDQLHSLHKAEGSIFANNLSWEWLKCPICGFRPFLKDDEITLQGEDSRRIPEKIKIGKVAKEEVKPKKRKKDKKG